MLLQRVWFLSGFGLKTGKHFAHFGLGSGMVFERRTYSIPNEKERELSDFEMDVNKKIFFCCCSIQSIDDIISYRPGLLKTGGKNDSFWSKIGSGVENPAAHPHKEFLGVPLPTTRGWAELELTGIALKRPKMPRTHHQFNEETK